MTATSLPGTSGSQDAPTSAGMSSRIGLSDTTRMPRPAAASR